MSLAIGCDHDPILFPAAKALGWGFGMDRQVAVNIRSYRREQTGFFMCPSCARTFWHGLESLEIAEFSLCPFGT
jgi:hypothetical protein